MQKSQKVRMIRLLYLLQFMLNGISTRMHYRMEGQWLLRAVLRVIEDASNVLSR
jgi:hypothetical protein